jgi:hypothetical protein
MTTSRSDADAEAFSDSRSRPCRMLATRTQPCPCTSSSPGGTVYAGHLMQSLWCRLSLDRWQARSLSRRCTHARRASVCIRTCRRTNGSCIKAAGVPYSGGSDNLLSGQ